jgi:hypothetical protein
MLIIAAPIAVVGLFSGGVSREVVGGFAMFLCIALVYAYLIAVVPSLLHAVAMEWVYRKLAKPHHWRAVACSTTSGLLAGGLMALVFAPAAGLGVILIPLGLCVGFLLGIIVRKASLTPLV